MSALTFILTEAQRAALSFAALSEAENLQEGHEAHIPEVQEAIASLWEARLKSSKSGKTLLSSFARRLMSF